MLCSGPAGTGKTESVKALGHQMGRFVLVFNCDERFDFQVGYCSCCCSFITYGEQLSYPIYVFKHYHCRVSLCRLCLIQLRNMYEPRH